jgi:hypothetical protein
MKNPRLVVRQAIPVAVQPTGGIFVVVIAAK